MKIKILTAFPGFVNSIKDFSIINKAIEKELVEIEIYDLRNWGLSRYRQIDDRPYGGGAGMVYMVEPIDKALGQICTSHSYKVLTSAKGTLLNYEKCLSLSKKRDLVIVCGHFEGVDHRVSENLIDEEISIGNYILSGGEMASMVMVDSVVRLIPGVIKREALLEETNSENYEYPQYSRPENYKGMSVPKVLLSGDHEQTRKWRKAKMKRRTQ